jgi:hypothetical protein
MSDLTNSLAVAHRLREQGFDNLLDSQPEIRDAFIVLWQQGNSLHEARRQLSDRYTNAQVPSVKALSTYVKKNLKHSTIATRSPEYVQIAAKFDSVHLMYRIANEAKERYEYARDTNASWRTQSRMLMNMLTATEKVLAMEIRLGLRQPVSEMQTHVIDTVATTGTQYGEDPEYVLKRSVDFVNSFDEFRAKVESLQANPLNASAE